MMIPDRVIRAANLWRDTHGEVYKARPFDPTNLLRLDIDDDPEVRRRINADPSSPGADYCENAYLCMFHLEECRRLEKESIR